MRVFLSYRSEDRERVRAIAEALLAAGIDAWWDVWEIRPGENFVSKLNDGLEQCDAGVVFLSNTSLAGAWHQDEITILKTYAVDDKRPLIPVPLDRDVKIPAILRPYSRVTGDQVRELVDAILYRGGNRPKVRQSRPTATCERFSIHLRELEDGQIAVKAQLDGRSLADEILVQPDVDFVYSYQTFVESRLWFAPGASVAAHAQQRQKELWRLGDAIGKVVFAGEIGRELAARLDAKTETQEIELVFEPGTEKLLSIPYEAARFADGRIPALLPGVFSWRRPFGLAGANAASERAAAGPLKILVAIGAPDEGKTKNSALNYERELETILRAVDKARDLGNCYVRILEVGSPQQIGSALRESSFHVLHLSGHGGLGTIELEDEDGFPTILDASRLAEEIRESGQPAPLVVLAACHGGRGNAQKASFAQSLLKEGVRAVVAMQTSVSDDYSTALTGQFYGELARAEQPLASRALALARRALEKTRGTAKPGTHEEGLLEPQYATAALFLRVSEHALIDRALEMELAREPELRLSSGAVPLLDVGALIGRRQELRRVMRVLSGESTAVGCQILGAGGVGKSSLAGRVMQRMAERGSIVVTLSGAWTGVQIAEKVGGQLAGHTKKEWDQLGRGLLDESLPERARLDRLTEALSRCPVLLVLDNFEDMLSLSGEMFLNPAAEHFFVQQLLPSLRKAKLLVTSRYPVPGVDEQLYRLDLGPLSSVETRKLILRLEGTERLRGEDKAMMERAIGGHPRALEYLYALLHRRENILPEVLQRLRRFAREQGISLDGESPIEDRLRDAIRVAAADALVEELVRLIGRRSSDLALLWQASVYPDAMPAEALAIEVTDSEVNAAGSGLAGAFARLTTSSLLTAMGEDRFFVHRWTAEALQPLMGTEVYQACCLRGAEYLVAHAGKDGRHGFGDLRASVRLQLRAEAFDKAARSASTLITVLSPRGHASFCAELAQEIGDGLPEGHLNKHRLLGEAAGHLRVLGLVDAARRRYARARELAERVALAAPERSDLQYDLVALYQRSGEIEHALGNVTEARLFFVLSINILERLVGEESDRLDFQRGLAQCYTTLGDLELSVGNAVTARQRFVQSIQICELLVSKEPDRSDFQRDLSVSYLRLGDLEYALGEKLAARQVYAQCLQIAECLARNEPDRADLQNDLAFCYDRIAEVETGPLGRQFLIQSLQIRERLALREPERADLQLALATTLFRFRDVEHMTRALDIAQRLRSEQRLSPADLAKFAMIEQLVLVAIAASNR